MKTLLLLCMMFCCSAYANEPYAIDVKQDGEQESQSACQEKYTDHCINQVCANADSSKGGISPHCTITCSDEAVAKCGYLRK